MLYLIQRNTCDYDEVRALLIRAESSKLARIIASAHHADENINEWLDPKKSTCKKIKVEGNRGVIMTDYKAA